MKIQRLAVQYVAIFLLTACGFSPVYQDGSSVGEAVQNIRLADPKGKDEFKFLTKMQRKFPPMQTPTMSMEYNLSLNVSELADRREKINGTLSYNVIDIKSGASLIKGQEFSTTSRTTSSETSGHMVNEASWDDAIDRLVEMLSQAVYHQLIIRLASIESN